MVVRFLENLCKTQSIHISSSIFSVYFTRKNLLFLFYTSIFTKHPHQFIYSTHLFNKIFIILLIFIIHSLTVLLSHRLTATITTTITTQPPSPPSLETNEKSDQSTHTQINPINPDLHASTPPRLHTYPDQRRSTQTSTPPNLHASTHTQISADQPRPPRLHTYTNQPDQPRPTATITASPRRCHQSSTQTHTATIETTPHATRRSRHSADLATLAAWYERERERCERGREN